MNRTTEDLYKQFGNHLKQFIFGRVRDEHTAKDVLQETFLKIHSGIEMLRDETKLESWIYQIARNAIIDHYRSRRSTEPVPDSIAEEIDEEEAAKKIEPSVREMIGQLPVDYREALLLTEYKGLTQKELAAKLGISLSGAKSRVQRARGMLRDLLMKCCHFEFDRYGTIIDYHPIACRCCTPPDGINAVRG